jgi:DNA polymerase-3 subunit gamma/tau
MTILGLFKKTPPTNHFSFYHFFHIFASRIARTRMSNFIVSARKYRPITFDSVVGQKHVTDTLKNAIRNDHLAHAFLFTGPRGVGKTTCARILAKVLNCQSPTAETEPCDRCDSCLAFNKNASLNIHELDAASNNSVEHIRALIEQVRFAPQNGRYKIYIIDEVHMLSQAAFNAFLKTLEEPPGYALFILATTEKHKIIPTILSRCQIFDFKRIQVADMAGHLRHICSQEDIEAEDEALQVIAQKADGGLRDALSIFDRIVSIAGRHVRYADVVGNLNILDYDYYFRLTEAMLEENAAAALSLFDKVLQNGFEGDIFLNGFAEHLRNLLVCQDPSTLELLEATGSLRERYAQQAALAPTSLLLSGLAIANDCDVNYKMARNKRLHVEMALLRMCYILRRLNEPTIAPPASPEKKTPDVSAPPSAPAPKAAPEGASLPKLPSLASLSKIAEAVQSEQNSGAEPKLDPTPENLRTALSEYARGLPQHLSLPAVIESIEVRPLPAENQMLLMVETSIAKQQVQGDGKLIEHLRTKIALDGIALLVEIDADKQKALIEAKDNRPKPLGPKEIFAKMSEVNPLVGELQKRFDLRLDR